MIILVKFSHMVYEDIEGSMNIADFKVGSIAAKDWG